MGGGEKAGWVLPRVRSGVSTERKKHWVGWGEADLGLWGHLGGSAGPMNEGVGRTGRGGKGHFLGGDAETRRVQGALRG